MIMNTDLLLDEALDAYRAYRMTASAAPGPAVRSECYWTHEGDDTVYVSIRDHDGDLARYYFENAGGRIVRNGQTVWT